MSERTLTDVLGAYIECALWAETDNANDIGGEPLNAHYAPGDLAPETLAAMRADVDDFLAYVQRESIDRTAWTDEQLGHDFWLTRNRHGAGFWDRGHGPAGDRLTDAAHTYGESDLYVGDDGMLYVN